MPLCNTGSHKSLVTKPAQLQIQIQTYLRERCAFVKFSQPKLFHAAVILCGKSSYVPCPPSTVPFDMEPEILPEGAPVPLNDLGEEFIKENSDSFASISTVVPLNPKPWLRKWENLQTPLDGFRCSIF